MKYLLKEIEQLLTELKDKKIYLFLDYDGTLTQITDSPAEANISGRMREIIQEILLSPDITPVIISGRSLPDLKNKIKIPCMIYAGNHGLEMDSCGLYVNFAHDNNYKASIESIEYKLRQNLGDIKGVLLENKGMALALHYRLVPPEKVALVKKVFTATVKPLIREGKFRINTGNKDLELIPAVAWDKGKFIKWLLATGIDANSGAVAFYFGDGLTDEEAFQALGNNAYTVLVGTPRKSAARYFLRNPQEVIEVLGKLVKNAGKMS